MGVRIVKEMPGSVASGTSCSNGMKECEVYRASKMNERQGKCLDILLGNVTEGYDLVYIGIGKRMVLEGSLKRQCLKLVNCTCGKRNTPCSRNGIIYKSNSVNRIIFYYYLQMYTSNSTNNHVILPKDLS
jgi:hypothetical protein